MGRWWDGLKAKKAKKSQLQERLLQDQTRVREEKARLDAIAAAGRAKLDMRPRLIKANNHGD